MGNPEAPQYEKYWRDRIASDIEFLVAESWGNDMLGLMYSDGLNAAVGVALKGPE